MPRPVFRKRPQAYHNLTLIMPRRVHRLPLPGAYSEIVFYYDDQLLPGFTLF